MVDHSFIDHWGGMLSTVAATGLIGRYASLAVRALPEPLPMGNRFYLWLYKFTQSAFANPDLEAAAAKADAKAKGAAI